MMLVSRPEEMNLYYDAAFNSGDIEFILLLYEPCAKMLPDSLKIAIGVNEIRAVYQKWLEMKGVMKSETLYCIEVDHIAVLRTQWSLNSINSEGILAEVTGDAIEVIRRQSDGSWRYIIDHSFGASARGLLL